MSEDKKVDIKEGSEVVDDVPLEAEKLAVESTTVESKEEREKDGKNEDNGEDGPPLPVRNKEPSSAKLEAANPLMKQLQDAFPDIEDKYLGAILIAAKGDIDSSFNACLYVSDPETCGIPIPEKPVLKSAEGSSKPKLTQYEQDEILARQLSEKYNSSRGSRKYRREDQRRSNQRMDDRQRRQNTRLTDAERREYYDDGDDSWGQFVDKDLPEIRDMANKQIQETATKLNNWFGDLKKNFSNETTTDNGVNNNNDYGFTRDDRNNGNNNNMPQSRERFNSFGARISDDSLERHGISLRNEDDYEDVPPQLPTRTRTKESLENKGNVTPDQKGSVVAQTAYIDTPDTKKYQALSPEPMTTTPTKIKLNVNPDDDDFLINSDDEI